MKKLNKIILFVIAIVGSILGITNVNALTDSIGTGSYIKGPYYYNHTKGSRTLWEQSQFIIRKSDGAVVFCVQPFVKIKDNNVYQVTTEDMHSVANISYENWKRIEKIAYYGYGYTDATHNHSAEKWAAATQMLIWRYADPTVDSYFTNTLHGTRNDNILRAEMNEIEELVNQHTIKPKFDNIPSNMVIGNTITLTDVNGVLSKYNIENVKGGTITKNGNTISIKANEVGQLSFTLSNLGNRYGEPVKLYYATDSQNVVRRGNIDPIRMNLNINVLGGKVTPHKTDEDTFTNVPQGEATLAGAVYGIYKEDGTRVGSVTTGEDGTATSDYLPSLGKFYLLEEKAPEGYQLDKNKYFFELTEDDLNVNVQVFDKVINLDFDITKVYASDKTGIMKPEVNIQFAVYNNKGEEVRRLTTDEQGNIKFNLPYGTYTLKQLTTTNGHEKAEDIILEVKETGAVVKKVIANSEITAKLKVVKVDENNKRLPIKDIRFKIKDVKTGKFICQTITYPNVENICEYKTTKDGELITPYPLNSGKYELYEVNQAIYGYLWNSKPLEFTIDENSNLANDGNLNKILEVHFANKEVKGEVEIHKVGEKVVIEDGKYTYEEIPLANVIFGLYDKDNNLIAQVTTDENGYAKFKDLKLQKYYLKEIKTTDGYVLDGKTYEFDLEYKDQYTPIISKTYNLKNYLVKGELEFTKTDLTDGKVIPNTKIEVFTENDELVFSGITDKNGQIIIKNLFAGKFYIVETEASAGYKITDEKVFFEIKENGEIVKAEMKNEAITGSLEITKVDLSDGTPLPNVLFEIYNDKDELVFSGRTNEEGIILVNNLKYGKYYILEKDAPEGYILNEEKMYFEILEDGEIIKSTIANEKIKVEVPNTLKNDYLTIGMIGLILLGTGTFIYGISKKKRKK